MPWKWSASLFRSSFPPWSNTDSLRVISSHSSTGSPCILVASWPLDEVLAALTERHESNFGSDSLTSARCVRALKCTLLHPKCTCSLWKSFVWKLPQRHLTGLTSSSLLRIGWIQVEMSPPLRLIELLTSDGSDINVNLHTNLSAPWSEIIPL